MDVPSIIRLINNKINSASISFVEYYLSNVMCRIPCISYHAYCPVLSNLHKSNQTIVNLVSVGIL
jgi:hypothetical protein